jgi:hypothetical protein
MGSGYEVYLSARLMVDESILVRCSIFALQYVQIQRALAMRARLT